MAVPIYSLRYASRVPAVDPHETSLPVSNSPPAPLPLACSLHIQFRFQPPSQTRPKQSPQLLT